MKYRNTLLSLMLSHMFSVMIIVSFQAKRVPTEALLCGQNICDEANKAVRDAIARGGTFLGNILQSVSIQSKAANFTASSLGDSAEV